MQSRPFSNSNSWDYFLQTVADSKYKERVNTSRRGQEFLFVKLPVPVADKEPEKETEKEKERELYIIFNTIKYLT
jgi:hypothetical protein